MGSTGDCERSERMELMTLMYELMRRGGGQGVAAICGGLSQGEALLLWV